MLSAVQLQGTHLWKTECWEGHHYFSVCALTLGPVCYHVTQIQEHSLPSRSSPGREAALGSIARAGSVNVSYEEMDGTVDFPSQSIYRSYLAHRCVAGTHP